MAVVFISPKQRQRMFLTGIISGVALIFIVVTLFIMFSKPKETYNEFVFNKPKVVIDFSIFDSEQFKNLEPFSGLKIQFSYKGRINNEEKEGLIYAVSMEEAKKELEDLGYVVSFIEETEVGRDNPFENYDSSLPAELQDILEISE